jgi:Raf kinase inhibitor-like YbhB/YbcL family protein
MRQKSGVICLMILLFFCCQNQSRPDLKAEGGKGMEISSTAFAHEGMIPEKYTCDGPDISPPLAWRGIPEGTASLALICDDPDAPVGTWVHWVVYDMPPDLAGLDEDLPPDETLENGARQGLTDFRRTGYGGPCPPGGTHRYFFKLYALDKVLNLEPGKTKEQLLEAMEGHILAESRLMGKYKRP